MHLARSNRGGKSPMDVMITAEGAGLSVPLTLPFVKLLSYIKEEVLGYIKTLVGSVDERQIGWVLTVPAIWDDEARGFMRRVAFDAGLIDVLDSSRLLLVLEPEGAAMSTLQTAPAAIKTRFKEGEGVLIIDAGGGTMDITVSEFVGTQPIRLSEVLPASGGPWGGTAADQRFLDFLYELLGPAVAAKVPQSGRVHVLAK